MLSSLSLQSVLFKVFIVGEAIKVVKRFSLPDICKPEVSGNGGVFHFPRVSCVAALADDADLDPSIAAASSPITRKTCQRTSSPIGTTVVQSGQVLEAQNSYPTNRTQQERRNYNLWDVYQVWAVLLLAHALDA
ncbi:hypothetical protein Droror1_Dr00010141 [Drosera rotundifolia]